MPGPELVTPFEKIFRREERHYYLRELADLRDDFTALAERAASLARELGDDGAGETVRVATFLGGTLGTQAAAQVDRAHTELERRP